MLKYQTPGPHLEGESRGTHRGAPGPHQGMNTETAIVEERDTALLEVMMHLQLQRGCVTTGNFDS